jgi:hypothetical protein
MMKTVEIYYKLNLSGVVSLFRGIYVELLRVINRSQQRYVLNERKVNFSRQYKDISWI